MTRPPVTPATIAVATAWIVAAVLLVVLLVGCTPAQIRAVAAASPADQARIAANYPRHTGGGDCYSALRHFPGDHGTARRIIHRESR